MFSDVAGHQIETFLVVEIDDANAVLTKPLDAAGKVPAITDYEGSNAELADESAAIPAWRERGNHHQVAIRALPACAAEGIRLAMDGWVAFLNAAIVPSADEFAVMGEKRGAYGDSALGVAQPRFVESDGEHLLIE